jgi:soluble lytic murein transglycosylase-like protein
MSIEELVLATAAHFGLDEELAVRQAKAESGLDPNAVSKAGAIGVMQLMPNTAKDLGADPHDPVQNIRAGLSFLKALLEHFGSYDLALAAYNWGPGNLTKCIRAHGAHWLDFAPTETRQYIAKILTPPLAPKM